MSINTYKMTEMLSFSFHSTLIEQYNNYHLPLRILSKKIIIAIHNFL